MAQIIRLDPPKSWTEIGPECPVCHFGGTPLMGTANLFVCGERGCPVDIFDLHGRSVDNLRHRTDYPRIPGKLGQRLEDVAPATDSGEVAT